MKLDDIDPREAAVRLGLAALAGLGVVVAMYASMIADLAPPIPYKFLPDLRPVVLFAATFAVASFAAWGPGRRRGFLIAYLLAIHGVFAFELNTVHWIIPYPGPIGANRAEPIRLACAISGLAVAVLLQARAHAAATRSDLGARGIPAAEAGAVADALRARAQRAVLLSAGAVVAFAFIVEGAAAVAGNEGSLPIASAVLLGAGLLLAAGVAVGLLARRVARASTIEA